MGAIREEVEIIGIRKSKKLKALFDSGACRNYIKRKFTDEESVENIGFHISEGTHKARLANGDIARGEKVRFREVRVKGCNFKEPEFVIMDNLLEEVIIGAKLMQELGITLDLPNKKVNIFKAK